MALPSYGSLTQKETTNASNADGETAQFNADNTYYLKSNSSRSASPSRCSKFLLIATPLLIAVLLMGGIVFFLLRDFQHLYPGRGGDPGHSVDSPYGVRGHPTIVEPSSDSKKHTTSSNRIPRSPSSENNNNKDSRDSDASCGAHSACHTLGLTGQCCPTGDGKNLECCSG